jgi:hypothetical protein
MADPDWALKMARDLIRRHFDSVVFKDEPNGLKRGGWADGFADDIARELRRQRELTPA